jgi:3-(methylthio)propionyl---CoA ligase
MLGLMQDRPMMISSILSFAAQYHGDVEIVSVTADNPRHRYGYADAHKRACKLANALQRYGVKLGDRIATLAWNDYRHFELYFGVSGIGAVLHTVNPRLFADQLSYIFNHAEDRLLFIDPQFIPLVEQLGTQWKSIERVVVLAPADKMPETSVDGLISYEEFISAESEGFDWPEFDERTASSLCYTSGTTGNPKGVLFSHRSTVLHTLTVAAASNMAIMPHDNFLPVVPMFHANAWGTPYITPTAGSKMVFPGAHLDGARLYALLEEEKVTMSAGVPTVWLGLLNYVKEQGIGFNHLQRVLIGGAAAPGAMIDSFEKDYGVTVNHAWGMTEMSPVGTIGNIKRGHADKPQEEILALKRSQGHAFWGCDLKIVDDQGNRLPEDGETTGDLYVKGYFITSGYYNNPDATSEAFDKDGWFQTGDVASIDKDGYLRITDRSKDVIKSGGEWISSIDLENLAVGHPDVAEAAVIGRPHHKWDERPLLIILPHDQDNPPSKESILSFMEGKIAKWWMPDDVAYVSEIPHTATGKIQKTELRKTFADFKFS